MPFDGFFMSGAVRELNTELTGARLDKIAQPSQLELRLSFRTADGVKKLLVSARPGSARLHLTDTKQDNPDVPPMFCMLVRKHLSGARLLSADQPVPERVCTLKFSCIDEFGDNAEKYLIFECAGHIPNIILCDSGMRVIDCVRRINLDSGEKARPVLPGLLYRYPSPPAGRLDPLSVDEEEFLRLFSDSGLPADRFLSERFFGLSPLVCRELAYLSGCGDGGCAYLGENAVRGLFNAFLSLRRPEKFRPYALFDRSGGIADFCFLPVRQYGSLYQLKELPSFSALLDRCYSEKDAAAKLISLKASVSKPVRTAAAKLDKKLSLQRTELKNTERREEYRKKADILSAYLFKIPRGASKVTLPDLYGADNAEIEIALDERLSPQQNAQKHYKEYSRLKSAKAHLETIIAEGEHELAYLKNVLFEISAADEPTLNALKAELGEFFPQKKGDKPRKPAPQKPLSFELSDGFTALCGRTGMQNEELTFKLSAKGDIWFHVKNAPGSHVILQCSGRAPTDRALYEAAKIAAEHSSLSGGKIPVDYTDVRYVKKIPGGKPGMVIYDKYSTIYI
jgi:predicted ribosome quality control (RQC) complex YloA/Tae2 family protein